MTATPKQIAFLESLRKDHTLPEDETVSANVAHVLDWATGLAATFDGLYRRVKTQLTQEGLDYDDTTYDARFDELYRPRFEQLKNQMHDKLTRHATDLMNLRRHSLEADLTTITKADASKYIDHLTSPAGLLALSLIHI